MIDNGKYGFYFKVGDASDLAEKILYIYQNYNSQFMKEKIELAYKRVKNEFDVAITAKRYLDYYQRIINDK